MSVSMEDMVLALEKTFNLDSSLEEQLTQLMEKVVWGLPGADAGAIYLYNKDRRQITMEGSYGYPGKNIKCSLLPREGIPGQCYALRKPLLYTSAEAVMELEKTLRPSSLDCRARIRKGLPPTRGIMVTPLMLRERTFGVLLLEQWTDGHRAFREADLTQLEMLGNLISLLIDDVQTHLELRHSKRSYRELVGRFITTSEEERSRIAREIHDEVNQMLLSARLRLEDVESTFPPEMVEVRERLQVIRSHINHVFDDLHRLSLSLRPPVLDELGLPQALEWYIQYLSEEAGLPIALEVRGLRSRRPAPVVETELFRIAQEALSNVVKHAQATSAKIRLEFNKSQLVLIAEDNGSGFDAGAYLSSSGGKQNLGLLGMKERAEICGGTLEIDAASSRGTRVKVEIPISSYDWGSY